jgi:hypothetical protein
VRESGTNIYAWPVMENNINQYLEDYLLFCKSLNNPQFAVLINGSWDLENILHKKNSKYGT